MLNSLVVRLSLPELKKETAQSPVQCFPETSSKYSTSVGDTCPEISETMCLICFFHTMPSSCSLAVEDTNNSRTRV